MSFEKLKIELTEKNEIKLREIHQFQDIGISFKEFINDWIAESLWIRGF